MNNWRIVIDEFNEHNKIRDVIETCIGHQVKGKSLCCPLHNGDNKNGSSFDEGKNIFTCWTSDCGRGLSPWFFIKKYYNLSTNKEVAEKVNQLFNANIPIYNKNDNSENIIIDEFDNVLKVDKYLNECIDNIEPLLEEYRHILLNGNTGIGKTYGITELLKNSLVDYVFFLVPTRALAEGVANEYNYSLFYGDDTELPKNKFIVSTFRKIDAVQRELNKINEYKSLLNQPLLTYTVVVDEVHELMSKRQLYGGGVSRRIEEFIINSDYSLLMSANTYHIYEAYKDMNLFNRYIKVESEKALYNSDKTYIYRISTKKKQRLADITNKIKESLLTHNNVLLMEDSKENLKLYSKILNKNNIPTIYINSDNRSDEEIINHYNSIVNDNNLNKTVVMCTSIINAGVNIKNENVCVMIIQNKLQFDLDKIEQFFGRIRSDKNNTCMVFLDQGEKNKFKSNKNYYINYYSKLGAIKTQSLNEYYFNKYGLDPVEHQIKTDWNVYKNNDCYIEVKDIIYLHNDIFKVDYISIHEKSRLKWLKDNYYDDNFILKSFKNLKTREIKIITLAPTNIDIIEESEDNENNTISFQDALSNVISDIKAVKEFNLYIRGTKKPKEFEYEPNKVLYNEFKTNKDFRSLTSELKSMMSKLLMIEDTTPLSTMLNVMIEYQAGNKKKERDENVRNIKRVEVYNKQFPLNTDVSITGDIIYCVVRKNCDCFVNHRKQPSKTAYKSMFIDYMRLNNGVLDEGEWFIKGKKIKPQTIKALLDNCIQTIYSCSDNLKLYALK